MSAPVDHPGPPCQWPGCARSASYFFGEDPWRLCPEHRDQEKKDAVAARLAEIERIKREAPGEWRWKDPIEFEDDEVDVLVDRADNVICNFGLSTQYYPSEGTPPDEPGRTLIAAAPEMEALLREHFEAGDDDANECDRTPITITKIDGQPYRTDVDRDKAQSHCGVMCFNCRLRALLARLDSAKAGG